MQTVHIHAWEYVNGCDAGGGGFNWYVSEAAARAAYTRAKASPNFAHFYIPEVNVRSNRPQDITREIDAALFVLCAKANKRKVSAPVLAYWIANGFNMGTRAHAAKPGRG